MNILKKISLNTSLLMITIFPLTTFAAVVSNGDFSEGSLGWNHSQASSWHPQGMFYTSSFINNSGFTIYTNMQFGWNFPIATIDESISQNIGTVTEGDTLSFDVNLSSSGYYAANPYYVSTTPIYNMHNMRGSEVRISNNLGSQTTAFVWLKDLHQQIGPLDPADGGWNMNDSFQIQIELDSSLAGGDETTLEIVQVGNTDDFTHHQNHMSFDAWASTTVDNIVISNANPVPVPAAAWLFGSALMGLSVVRRKK